MDYQLIKMINKIFKLFGKKGNKYSITQIDKRILSGVKKDKKDKRDYKVGVTKLSFPESYNLYNFTTPIKNQLNTNSCCGFGICAAGEIIWNIKRKEIVDFSELYSYYKAREIEGVVDKDEGVTLRDICKTANQDGLCLEEIWPFIVNKVFTKPNWIVNFVAHFNRIKTYTRCNTVDEIKFMISQNIPIIVGIKVYDNFFTCNGNYGEIVGKYSGNHCMCVVGYNKDFIILKNSWGEGWGNRGYVNISIPLFVKILNDAWGIE